MSTTLATWYREQVVQDFVCICHYSMRQLLSSGGKTTCNGVSLTQVAIMNCVLGSQICMHTRLNQHIQRDNMYSRSVIAKAIVMHYSSAFMFCIMVKSYINSNQLQVIAISHAYFCLHVVKIFPVAADTLMWQL